jgi:hypothetical protein
MAKDPNGNHQGLGVLVAAVALVICCALPLLAVAVGGALATAGGLAVRFWPLVVVGMVAAVWAAVKLTRTVRTNRHGQPRQDQPGRHWP